MNKLVAIAKLTRIEHSFMLVIAVVAAELIMNPVLPAEPILALSLITPFFISMSAFAINDYFDVDTDKANKRTNRPIVAGAISKNEALTVAVVTLLIGVIASFYINLAALIIAIVFGVLSFFYSYRLKDVVLLGNAYVAFSTAIPFIFGAYVVALEPNAAIVLICFAAFLGTFAREIHGMIRDKEGDLKIRKAKNLIFYIGEKKAAFYAMILYVESIGINVYLFFYQPPFLYNIVYIVPVTIANIMIFYVACTYIYKPSRKTFDYARNISLLAQIIILIAYLAAPLI